MAETRYKEDRVSIRLNAQHKSIIDQAALILGISRSSFILSNAVAAAYKVVEQHKISLSERDWDKFRSLVSSDVEPTTKAREAAKCYKEHRLA